MTYNAAAIFEVLSLAISKHQQGSLLEAEKLYRAILQSNPNHPDANYNFAILAVDLGYVQESLPYFEKAIEMHSISEQYYIGYIDALIRLGEIEKARGILAEAKWISSKETIEALEKRIPAQAKQLDIIELSKKSSAKNDKAPSNKEVRKWNTAYSNANYQEAEFLSRKMTEKYPNSGNAWKMLGVALMEMARHQDALHASKLAAKLLPNDAEAHYNLGVTFQVLGMIPQSIEHYEQGLKLSPKDYKSYANLGIIFNGEGKFSKAIEYYRKALEIKPDLAEAYNSLGSALNSQGNLAEAREYYYKAIDLKSKNGDVSAYGYVFGNILFSINYDPDTTAEEIFEVYREYNERFVLPFAGEHLPHTNDKNLNRRLKVGYVSPDFSNHPVRYFLEPLLENHNKSLVEVYAYAELVNEDETTQRYKGYSDHWIPTVGMSNETLAKRIREDGIDILVDLAGHTSNNRLGVFAKKPAPVSLSWLGYGYTTGLNSIDYYLTDEINVPLGSEHLFSEEPWRVESPAYVYSPAPGMGEVSTLPVSDRGYITFGTLTRAVRINHRTIRVWAELLKRVPNSKLIIDSKDYRDPSMREMLAERFQKHGIARERLEIGYHSPPWQVLGRMDVGVDCFPHNSGTTLFETLYMGIPYVTLADRVSVGRIGSAILHGLGRDEWIANTEEEYVDKLVALAEDPESLASIRAGLRDQMINSPLMNASGFTRKVEKAYREMFVKWCQEEQ